MDTFESSVEVFLKGATFLGDADKPMVTALRKTAETLDKEGVQASLVNQFRLIMKALEEKGNPENNKEADPLEALLG